MNRLLSNSYQKSGNGIPDNIWDLDTHMEMKQDRHGIQRVENVKRYAQFGPQFF